MVVSSTTYNLTRYRSSITAVQPRKCARTKRALSCPALTCITMCSLSYVTGDTQTWVVLCTIIYMTCAQCASIIPVLRHHTTRHMNRSGASSTYSWKGRYKLHLMKSILPLCLADALCIHRQCHWVQVQAV